MSAPAGGPAAEAAALARRLAALEEGPIRARAAARGLAALAAGDADRAARVLGALVRGTTPEARGAAAAVGQAVADPSGPIPYAALAAVYAAAAARELLEVTALLVAPPAHRRYEAPRDRADPRLAHLSLGHKKAFARAQRDPDLLARLAAEGEPSVVRELLRNPTLTEPFVVRIASRRPCRPETLRCVFDARRWRTRRDVALALARNPYLETGIALKLLPGLAVAELADVARDGVLHPLVRALAAHLAAERAEREDRRAGRGLTASAPGARPPRTTPS